MGKRLTEYNRRNREELKVQKSKQVEPMLDSSTCYSIGAVLAVEVIDGLGYYLYQAKKANNKYMGEKFNPDENTNFLQYLDANNLYGWAMNQPLPTGGFKWVNDVTPDEIAKLGNKGYL